MVSKKVTIKNPTGLHLRPAGELCKTAMQFKAKITFSFEGGTSNAKSVLSVLGACVKSGDEIELICEGEDEEEALKKNGGSHRSRTGRIKMKTEEKVKCPYEKKCGGCKYQGIPYEKQLKEKEKKVRKLLKDYGKPEPILGMEDPYYYRNKVHATYKHMRNGDIAVGRYEESSHRLVPIESCQIEDQKADEVIQTIRKLAKSFKIKIFNEDSGYGLLRHVLIRTGRKTGEMLVVLVVASPVFPSKNNFVKALRKEHPEITSIVLNINDKKTSMILGERNIVLYGKGYIQDELCGYTFRISPHSFYQVNPVQTERLLSLIHI